VSGIRIQRLSPEGAAGFDRVLVSALTGLVNEVYEAAEAGLWVPATRRCTEAEIAGFLRSEEMVVARHGDRLVGCLRLCRLDDTRAEFGVLAVAEEFRGIGLGRDLVDWAEGRARADGAEMMQLELLVPRAWTHPWKERLAGWYERLGYEQERVGRIDEAYPHLAPRLATACDFVVYVKKIGAAG
jgi:GNAT superfamily N-acetyltransferase